MKKFYFISLLVSILMLCSFTAIQVNAAVVVKPMISAGSGHTLSLTNEGKIYAWGDNTYGQLGDGSITSQASPVCISDISVSPLYGKIVVSISAGINYSLALTSDGKVYAWGNNDYGQLGDGTAIVKYTPLCISDITTSPLYGKAVTAITAGYNHSLAITVDGKIYAWGNNDCGQLGNNTTISCLIPICISDIITSPLFGKSMTLISAGKRGYSESFSLSVDSNGKVYAWGRSYYYGQLGDGNSYGSRLTPICISDITTSPLFGKAVTTITTGYSHSLALTSEGKIYAWGNNESGQLGDGSTNSKSIPISISDIKTSPLYGKTITSITTGYSHSFALTNEGKAYAWGINYESQLGDCTTTEQHNPVNISDNNSSPLYGRKIVAITANSSNSYALTNEGKVYAWGDNNNGQLGNGTTYSTILIPICTNVMLSSPLYNKNVSTILTPEGYYNSSSLALTSDGKVYGCGNNSYQQFSDAIESPLYGKTVKAITIGGSYDRFSLALTSEGKVYAWGNNDYGQLGDGTNSTKTAPICISDFVNSPLYNKTVTALYSSDSRSYAITSDGKVYAWGNNNNGQLGDGTTTNRSTPVCISDITTSSLYGKTVGALYVNSSRVFALTVDGKVYAWGNNNYGQFGDGTYVNSLIPIGISDITTSLLNGKIVKSLYAGNTYSYAITNDGKLYAWGFNYNAGLGDGNYYSQYNSPICISDISTSELYGKMAKDVYSTNDHTFVITSDGKLYSWGYNIYGQLGDGTTIPKYTPVCISDISTFPLNGKIVTSVSTYGDGASSFALTNDGKVYAWGNNNSGQLGDGTIISKLAPVCISDISNSSLNGKTVSKIYSNGNFSFAITSDGKINAWGDNSKRQLGDITQFPSQSLMPSEKMVIKYIDSITILGTDTIKDNNQASTFTASVLPTYADIKSVNWTVDNINIASIDKNGVLTPKANGTVIVNAFATDGSGASAQKTVTITGQKADDLINLNIGGTVISPEFNPSVYDYSTTVTATSTSITITPQIASGNTCIVKNNGSIVPPSSTTQTRIQVPTIVIDGNTQGIYFYPNPILQNGDMLVPIRIAGEIFGLMVSWDENTQTISFQGPSGILTMQLNSNIAYFNNIPNQMPVSVQLNTGYTMVPWMFVANQFGYNADYNSITNTIVFTKSDLIIPKPITTSINLVEGLNTITSTIQKPNHDETIYTINVIRGYLVKAITISGANTINDYTQSSTYKAIITPDNAENKEVIWSVDDTNLATIDQFGVLTPKANGTVIIRAASKDGTGIVGEKAVTLSWVTPIISPSSARISQNATVEFSLDNALNITNFEFTVLYDNTALSINETDENNDGVFDVISAKDFKILSHTPISIDSENAKMSRITISSQFDDYGNFNSSIYVAKIFTINFDIKDTATLGDAKVEIVSNTKDALNSYVIDKNGNKIRLMNSVNGVVNVLPKPIITELSILGQSSISQNKQTEIYTANIVPNIATNEDVVWSVDNTNIATIDQSGILTPISNGTVIVFLSAIDGSELIAQKTVIISGQKVDNITELTVSYATISPEFSGETYVYTSTVSSDTKSLIILPKMVVGNTYQIKNNGILISEIIPTTTPVQNITSTSYPSSGGSSGGDDGVGGVGGVVITPTHSPSPIPVPTPKPTPKPTFAGSIVNLEEGQNVITVAVIKPFLDEIIYTFNIIRGYLVKTVSVFGADTISSNKQKSVYTIEITPNDADIKAVTWSIDNESIAVIDQSGVLTPNTNGTVIITATATDGSGIIGQKTVVITGQKSELSSITSATGVLGKPFMATTYEYNINVPKNASSILITPNINSGIIKINNLISANNIEKVCALYADKSVIKIDVSQPNKDSVTYTLNVIKSQAEFVTKAFGLYNSTQKLTTIPQQVGQYNVKSSYVNNSGLEKTVYYNVIIKDNNHIIKTKITKKTFAIDEVWTFEDIIDVPSVVQKPNLIIQCLLWDSLNSIKPLTQFNYISR